jgi:hypothetical protein
MSDLPDTGRPADDRIAADLMSLRAATEAAFAPPPIETLRRAAQRRTRTRAGIAAIAVTALAGAGGGVLAMADRGPDGMPRPSPTAAGSSTPAPSASVETSPARTAPASTGTSAPSVPDIRAVDWTHATIVLPANPDDPDCPTGRITTNGDRTTIGAKRFYIDSAALAHGDLTGNGSAEAVVPVSCVPNSEDVSGDGSGQLLVITWRNGTWTGLGYIGPVGQNFPAVRVSGQRVTVTVEQRYGGATQERTYRWNGQRFVQVGGPTTVHSTPG